MYFDRHDICAAYAMYDLLWGPTPYGSRVRRVGFRLGYDASLEKLSENSKAIYGRLVREHNRLYVAFSRFQKRNRNAPQWPGTYNMPGNDPRRWLQKKGLLAAVECYS